MSTRQVVYYGSAGMFLLLLGVAYALFMGRGVRTDTVALQTPNPADPLHATYRFGAHEVTLRGGVGEVSGTTTRFTVRSVGDPVYGDLNDDDEPDAVVVCSYEAEGRTTPCLLLAMHAYGGYVGMNALMLEAPLSGAVVRHGVIELQTSAGSATYAAFIGTRLTLVPLEQGERVLAGRVARAGETLTVTPCGGSARSVAADSPARAAVEATYAARLLEDATSVGMFAVVVAREEGTGETAELSVGRVVAAPSREDTCTEDDRAAYRASLLEPATAPTTTNSSVLRPHPTPLPGGEGALTTESLLEIGGTATPTPGT